MSRMNIIVVNGLNTICGSGKKLPEPVNSHWNECNFDSDAETIIINSQGSNSFDEPTSIETNRNQSVSNSFEDCRMNAGVESVSNNEVDVNWNDLFDQMQKCIDFNSLKHLFEKYPLPPLDCNVALLQRKHRIDVNVTDVPNDAPIGCVPVRIFGDGNCFPRALSVAVGFDQNEKHREMRIRICREGVINKAHYLENNYVSLGAENTYGRSTFPIVYAQMSEYGQEFYSNVGESQSDRIDRWSRIAEEIYENEVFMSRKSGEWMWNVANISGGELH